jgi:phosphate transport system permease protein
MQDNKDNFSDEIEDITDEETENQEPNGNTHSLKNFDFEKDNESKNKIIEDRQEDRASSIDLISLKKKFRLSEFLAEKIITSVAFLSITIIILIFIFVFKETLPIFGASDQTVKNNSQNVSGTSTGTTSPTTSDKPERYGVNYESAPPEAAPEDNSNAKPETYGVTPDPKLKGVEETSSLDAGKTASSESETAGREGKANLKSLSGTEWMPVSDNPRYGLLPLFLGTFKLTLIAIMFAAPIGILAALFTSAFAPSWMREIVKPAIELLAGFPSVVIGFFALMVMATVFQDLFGYGTRLNGFVGGVAMALSAIPIIYTITEDALTSVPKTYKEASLALGASTWQTAFFVTLPAATPGIFAAVLLGVGRVFGETMIALMATGNAAIVSANPFDSVRALSATIGAEMAEVVFGDTHYNVLFLIGSLLFVFTFILNIVAEFWVRGKLVNKFQGAN